MMGLHKIDFGLRIRVFAAYRRRPLSALQTRCQTKCTKRYFPDGEMYRVFTPLMAAAAFFLITTTVSAQEKLKIGLIYSLSGPPSVLGQQSKNGFELALKDLGGKMGGRDVELFIVDDELKPDVAIQKVRGFHRFLGDR